MAQLPQIRTGRPEAAAVIWRWQPTAADETASHREAGPIRLRGTIQATVGLAVAGLLAWWGYRIPAIVVGSVASTIALAALLSPLGLFAAIERVFATLGRWIGSALTWILLPIIFYLFFVPFSALFRRGRRDSMRRYFEPESETYWSSRAAGNVRTASSSHQRPY